MEIKKGEIYLSAYGLTSNENPKLIIVKEIAGEYLYVANISLNLVESNERFVPGKEFYESVRSKYGTIQKKWFGLRTYIRRA